MVNFSESSARPQLKGGLIFNKYKYPPEVNGFSVWNFHARLLKTAPNQNKRLTASVSHKVKKNQSISRSKKSVAHARAHAQWKNYERRSRWRSFRANWTALLAFKIKEQGSLFGSFCKNCHRSTQRSPKSSGNLSAAHSYYDKQHNDFVWLMFRMTMLMNLRRRNRPTYPYLNDPYPNPITNFK